jgi:excisionase family DNA binding protein
MNTIESDIMTIEDVTQFLRIPVSSAYKLAQAGKIPGIKVGRHWRFHRPTITQWVAGQVTLEKKKSDTEPREEIHEL